MREERRNKLVFLPSFYPDFSVFTASILPSNLHLISVSVSPLLLLQLNEAIKSEFSNFPIPNFLFNRCRVNNGRCRHFSLSSSPLKTSSNFTLFVCFPSFNKLPWDGGGGESMGCIDYVMISREIP